MYPDGENMESDKIQMLQGCRVLVVEDEYFLADDLRSELEAHGASVIGPVGNLPDALAEVERDGFDVAIIDINLHDEPAFVLADKLVRQNVPFFFTTGYGQDAIPSRFDNVVRWEKPYVTRQVAEEVRRFCTHKHDPTRETP